MKRILGIDIGYGYTKVATQSHQSTFPSVVAPAPEDNLYVDGFSRPCPTVSVNGTRYLVGDEALSFHRYCGLKSSNTYDAWVYTPEYRALLLKSLIPFKDYSDVCVVTGLPVANYKNPSFRESFSRAFYSYLPKGYTLLRVIPQALGAYIDYCVGEDGTPDSHRLSKKILVADGGFYTFGWVLIEDSKIVPGVNDSLRVGFSNICEIVAGEIKRLYGLDMSLHEVDTAIRAGQIHIRGNPYSIGNLTNKACERVAGVILSTIRSRFKDALNIDLILLAGGAGRFLSPYFEPVYPHLHCLDNLAIARGYVKAGILECP